jgi:hypothetical protein
MMKKRLLFFILIFISVHGYSQSNILGFSPYHVGVIKGDRLKFYSSDEGEWIKGDNDVTLPGGYDEVFTSGGGFPEALRNEELLFYVSSEDKWVQVNDAGLGLSKSVTKVIALNDLRGIVLDNKIRFKRFGEDHWIDILNMDFIISGNAARVFSLNDYSFAEVQLGVVEEGVIKFYGFSGGWREDKTKRFSVAADCEVIGFSSGLAIGVIKENGMIIYSNDDGKWEDVNRFR